MIPIGTHRTARREGNVMAEFSKPRAWPDRCPACAGRMEFGFRPAVHRKCTRAGCGRVVSEGELQPGGAE